MKLSVIILNYNVRYFLELCLQSVVAATQNISAEIIVVDNQSPDDSCQMVKTKFPKIKLIENKENLGFSKGNNIGVKEAKGEYLCILNPDTVVPKHAFVQLLQYAESINDLGIIGCQLIDGNGNFLPESKRNIPTPRVALKKILGNGQRYYSDLKTNETGKVEILVGAFMLLKTKVYKEVGGFDEDYFMYGEDIDLSYKILKKGYQNYYNGNISVIHFKGESTTKDKIYAKRFYGAMQLFYKKHFKTNVLMNVLVYLGIKTASLLNSNKIEKPKNRKGSFILSEQNSEKLKEHLPKPISQSSDLKNHENEDLIILDADIMDYTDIIDIIKSKDQIKNNGFRIWPKKCNFIIGSDTNNGQGEIIKF